MGRKVRFIVLTVVTVLAVTMMSGLSAPVYAQLTEGAAKDGGMEQVLYLDIPVVITSTLQEQLA